MSIGEFQLIDKFFSRSGAKRTDVVLGVGDDAAIMRMPPGQDLVAAADTIVSGVHFPPELAPEFIGHRALAVNLSDMAAMGAAPAWCTLSLTLPAVDEHWLEGFSRGFRDLAASYGVALVGGDTTSGPLTIAVQILGLAPPGMAIQRSGARPGDVIFVSGTIGDAAMGLALLQGGASTADADADAAGAEPAHLADQDFLQKRFTHPTPRVELGMALRGIASAAIDISDGLHADLGKLLQASEAGARLDLDALPLSQCLLNLAGPQKALDYALAGGDDYELCFTVPPDKVPQLERLGGASALMEAPALGAAPASRSGMTPAFTYRRIGTVEAVPGVRGYQSGQPVDIRAVGYDHFLR